MLLLKLKNKLFFRTLIISVFIVSTFIFEVSAQNHDDLTNEGIRLYNQGNVNGALDMLIKSMAINPQDTYTLYHIGVCYLAMNRTQEATKYFEMVIKLEPRGTHSEQARLFLESINQPN
jgi:tetratricopeptide (TPR) repeat protein